MQFNKVLLQYATETQKRLSMELAAEARAIRREEEASVLWRRMVINAVYRRTQITDPSVVNWLFVGLLTVTHMATGTQVPLPQLEQGISLLVPDLQVYEGTEMRNVANCQVPQTETGLSGQGKYLPEKTEQKSQVQIGKQAQERISDVSVKTQGQASCIKKRAALEEEKEVVSVSRLQKRSSYAEQKKIVLEPETEEPGPKIKLGQAVGSVRVSVLRGYIPVKPDALRAEKELPIRHYGPLLGDDHVQVRVPEDEETEIVALSQVSFNLPQFFHMEEMQEWRYACLERTFKELGQGGVLDRPVLTKTGIYSRGYAIPQDLLFLYFEDRQLKVCTNRYLQWRSVPWNGKPYQYNAARALWKFERANRFLLGLTEVSHMGHDPEMQNLLTLSGHGYREWWSWEKIPSVSALLCFHSLHHAGYHSLRVINEQGPDVLVIQDHGSQLSEADFYKVHEQYGDHPRYLAQIGTPALERGFKNYVLVFLEERKGKDLFLVYLRKKNNPKGLVYRGDDPGEGWIRHKDSFSRKVPYSAMRKIVTDLVSRGKPFSVIIG